ncbi:MAG: helix-hairpin-helix domain-containing protein [Coriobacteriales bacterium]|nr:helix-hairpin-helix domain-containing protein [Coriobacteriales bacterium]
MAQISNRSFDQIQHGHVRSNLAQDMFSNTSLNNNSLVHKASSMLNYVATKMRLSDVPKSVLVVIILLCVVAGLLGWILHESSSPFAVIRTSIASDALEDIVVYNSTGKESDTLSAQPVIKENSDVNASKAMLYIHVDGAVKEPGVYAFYEGQRAKDAIEAAGGLAENANTRYINLAAPLVDGTKLTIPSQEENEAIKTTSQTSDPYVVWSASTSASGNSQTALININTASKSDLCNLPGIGDMTAQAIIEDREQNGVFNSIEDLMRVTGIGEKKFKRLSSLICV